MNILIASCGTRNMIVRYFKQALTDADGTRTGTVVATDMSELAPALYEADKQYIVPRITEPGYVDVLLDICRKENITGILSLIDPELSLLAKHKDAFASCGTTVIGSSVDLCEMSLDKFAMYEWLVSHGYRCAASYRTWQDFARSDTRYPVFVKPICGSASIAIAKAEDEKTAKFLFEQREGMMVQEFLRGQEIGADVYIDMISGEVVSIFTKKKLVMRAGETDKSVSFRDEKLFALIEKFVKEAGYRGQIDIDLFETDGEYYISEVNPRFGGGYPHAYECGCDHMRLITENLSNRANQRCIGSYEDGRYMMKYNALLIR